MGLVDRYHAVIEGLLRDTGLSDKTMHVHVGMAIFLCAQVLLRTRRGSIGALLVVFAAEAFNETMDRLFSGSWQVADTVGDVAATLFWPTAVVLVSRYRRRRWTVLHRRADAAHRTAASPVAPEVTAGRAHASMQHAHIWRDHG